MAGDASAKPKLLILPAYTEKGPSSRYRTYKYVPYLETSFEVTISPLFSDAYYNTRFGRFGRLGVLWESFRCYLKRLWQLSYVKGYDVVLLEKQLWPFLPAFCEKYFLRKMRHLVIDFDDAVWHQYDEGRPIIRKMFGDKFDQILPLAELCVCGCKYLADKTSQYSETRLVPSVIDYTPQPTTNQICDETEPYVVGWIGSPSTSKYILQIVDQLEAASTENPVIRYSFVGFDQRLAHRLAALPHQLVSWYPGIDQDWLPTIDLGIMPLDDTPFSRGKCGFKLVQYMSGGKVWAATALQTNVDLDIAQCNYLVERPGDWTQTLLRCSTERHQQVQCGAKNYEAFATQLNYNVTGPQLTRILQGVLAADTGV